MGKWAAALLAILLVWTSAVPGAQAQGLSDLTGHWAEAAVQAAIQAGLVTGYPDGSFRPNEPVTRAQFITLMLKVRGLGPEPGTGGFTDLQGHWLAGQGLIQAAVEAGLVVPSDYGDPPVLQPDRPLTRQEAAIFAVRAMNRLGAALTLHGAPLPYQDQVPDWTTGYLAAAYSSGVMKGQDPETFGAARSLTRAEAAVIALRVRAAATPGTGAPSGGAPDDGAPGEVPVWEANSWQAATLPQAADEVAAAPDGTLYWLLRGRGEIWQMKPGQPPALFYSGLEDHGPVLMAAGPGGVYLAWNFGVFRITPDGRAGTWVGDLQWSDDLQHRGYRNGKGTAAKFQMISGLCADPVGNLYIVEDGRVRKADPEGNVSLLAGRSPRQALVLKEGLLYNASMGESGDGPGYLAALGGATACAADRFGNVFVGTQDGSIRKVAPDGTVSWYAGGTRNGSDGATEEAGFGQIQALAADSWGDLWVADWIYNRIRRITPDGHVYTVAGGGGRVLMMHNMGGSEWPQWLPDEKPADGPGPDARFGRIGTLALAGGRLYLTDEFGSLRTISGSLDWYPAAKSMVLQPLPDDIPFWAPGAERFQPGPVRLGVALYGPAEAVGLKVDGERVDEAHHPLYTLRWDATAGSHQLTPLVRRPDGTWLEGDSRAATVAADGLPTSRTELVYPRTQAWLRGTVTIKVLSDWKKVKVRVDDTPVAEGTGLVTADWDTTAVADGIHRIYIATEGNPYEEFREVIVANDGFPPPEPEDDGFVLYYKGQRFMYEGSLLPETQDGIPMLPLRETAAMMGFDAAFDPEARLITLTGHGRTATLNLETGETTGMVTPVGIIKAVPAGDDFLVDWLLFVGVTGTNGAGDLINRIIIFREN